MLIHSVHVLQCTDSVESPTAITNAISVVADLCSTDATAGLLARLKFEILEAHSSKIINAYVNNSDLQIIFDRIPTWNKDKIPTASKLRALATQCHGTCNIQKGVLESCTMTSSDESHLSLAL